jgi:PLP dependent protein
MVGAPTAAEIADRMQAVRARLAAAGGPAVELVAVTKGFPSSVVAAALAAGCDRIGESYAQEWAAKSAELTARPFTHFIGQLQTNKVRQLVGIVDVYESVDRPSLVAELARRAPGAEVLVQVNATDEPGKAGCRPDQVDGLVADALAAGLRVDGLMTVGPTEGGPAAAAAPFRLVRGLVDRLGLRTCSMGMTDDLEIAVAEGSTRVRVGTALFGARPRRE